MPRILEQVGLQPLASSACVCRRWRDSAAVVAKQIKSAMQAEAEKAAKRAEIMERVRLAKATQAAEASEKATFAPGPREKLPSSTKESAANEKAAKLAAVVSGKSIKELSKAEQMELLLVDDSQGISDKTQVRGNPEAIKFKRTRMQNVNPMTAFIKP